MAKMNNGSNGTNGAGTAAGPEFPTINAQQFQQFKELVENAYSFRDDFLGKFFDPRRDVWGECGWPEAVLPEYFRTLYDRNPIAKRVVEMYPKECWQVTPQVYEDDKAKKPTPFEEDWDDLPKNLVGSGTKSWFADEQGSAIWPYLIRGDINCGIGTFGIILLGLDDGMGLQHPAYGVPPDGMPKDVTGVSQDIWGTPLSPGQDQTSHGHGNIMDGSQPPGMLGTDAQYFQPTLAPYQPPNAGKGDRRKLLYLRAFDQSLVQVVRYEASMFNPRYMMPTMYRVTLNDPRQPHTGVGLPLATVYVHWSRVIHLADNLINSETFGWPRCQPVLNNLLDLAKLYGGSAEMYWRGAFPGLSIETHPQLGGDVAVDRAGLRNMVSDYHHHLSRVLLLMGMSAKSLSPQVVDPTAQIAAQIQAICIALACPQRVFMGSERGELASSQDDDKWLDMLRHRQHTFCTPFIIKPFVDRLIALKVLREPEQYHVRWPDLDSLGDKDKAGIALQLVQALAAYQGGNVAAILPEKDLWTRVIGWDEEEVDQLVKDAAKEAADKEDENQALADKHGMPPAPPPGFQKAPEPPPPPGAPQPQKLNPGQSLVHPDTGKVIGTAPGALPTGQPSSQKPGAQKAASKVAGSTPKSPKGF